MARGKTNNQKSAASNMQLKKPMMDGGNKMNAFQAECKQQLEKLCNNDSTTILNVVERFRGLSENMERIQENHKKKNGWKVEGDLLNKNSLEERLEKCNNHLSEMVKKYDLENLNNIKVVKEYEGLGLRKSHKNNDNLHNKENNQIRIPLKAMLTCDSICASKEFEIFLRSDRMTAQMMNVRLALRLIYHKYDTKSEFQSWLNTLPNDYTTPMYWSENDFECLATGFEACNEDALTSFKFYTTISRQYLYFLSVFSTIPSLKKFYSYFTWDAYKWAVSTVQTRANQLTKQSLGFIPVLELCNTNLKSELVIGRIFKDEENKTGGIIMAELDISKIGNNKNIYFSYSGNINNRSSLQSLIHNALCFKEKVEVTVHLPQSKPLHQEKVDYMKYVGGDDFNNDACLSPLVKIKHNDKNEIKEFSLKQMINFLVVALDREPKEEEMESILVERKKMEEFEKTVKSAREENLKFLKSVEEAKKKNETIPEKPDNLPVIPTIKDRPERDFIYDYSREELRPKAKQFLKIRLSVLKRYLDKIDYNKFDNQTLKSYVQAKHELFNNLIEMVDTV